MLKKTLKGRFAAAEAIAGKLTVDSINSELSKAGLPAATVLEAAIPALSSSNTLSPELTASKEETADIPCPKHPFPA